MVSPSTLEVRRLLQIGLGAGLRQPIYQPIAITRLNLIYHVCPLKQNAAWRGNLAELAMRWRVFTGRKILAVTQGVECHSTEIAKSAIPFRDYELLEIPNDSRLREVATFLPLLEAIQSSEPTEATFYAHTKGNSTAGNREGAARWRQVMYRALLDGVQIVRDLLLTHPCVGTHKMVWPDDWDPPYPSGLRHGSWMFAGTFFWFRHDAVFTRPDWRNIPDDRYGAEAWLSGMFSPLEAVSVYQPWPVDEYPTANPYDPTIY